MPSWCLIWCYIIAFVKLEGFFSQVDHDSDSIQSEEKFESNHEAVYSDSGVSAAGVVGGVVGAICLVLGSFVIVKIYRGRAKEREGLQLRQPLVSSTLAT